MNPTILFAFLISTFAPLSSGDSSLLLYSRTAIGRAQGTIVPWPKRLNYSHPIDFFEIDPQNFNISVYQHTEIASCGTIERAANRFIENNWFFDDLKPENELSTPPVRRESTLRPPRKLGKLVELSIYPQRKFLCENLPSEDMDEDYTLAVNIDPIKKEPVAVLTARTNWGILRGLETFSQLIYNADIPGSPSRKGYAIRLVYVDDKPRFKFRGFMLDTARHYIPTSIIKKHLDAMASVKFNVFHWHLTDDQSFPVKLTSIPTLEKFAFRPIMTYTKDDIQDIVRYAADRGIRVIPEIDSPGHTYSMRSIPKFLTRCYEQGSDSFNDYGPVDPTIQTNYKVVGKIFSEMRQIFPDSYFHIGGDEVPYECWKSNQDITRWMQTQRMDSNYNKLYSYYIRRLYDIVASNNRTMMVWEEAFNLYNNDKTLPQDTIVQVWKDVNNPILYKARIDTVVDAGYRALLSACWYLDLIQYGADWEKFYLCDPTDTPSANPRKKELVLGGEACLWTEFVDESNVLSRAWPRAAAAAERLWSAENVKSVKEFQPRLEQLRCRMKYRGIDAEPINGPGYC